MPSAKIENTTPYTTYSMTVKARNVIGWGPESPPVEAQFNWNSVNNTNYVDVPSHPWGGTWRVHTFTTTDQLDVVSSINPWKVVLVSGGGGGGSGWYEHKGGNGGTGGGIEVEIPAEEVLFGDNLVTVGARGEGGVWNCCCGCGCCGANGQGGGTSRFIGREQIGGGGGTGGGAPTNGASRGGVTSSITGTSVTYRPGGGGGGQHASGNGSGSGGAGIRGEVIIAYKIGN
jgi:hypothetical protein